MRPTHATARLPYLCVAPMPREVGRVGFVHRTRNTLDARHRLAALARCRVTLCEICGKTAARRPCSSRRGRRGWRGRCWRGHRRNRERLEGAIFVGTAIRYSLRWAATAAVLAVMATVRVGHFTRVIAALGSVLVTCVLMVANAAIVASSSIHNHRGQQQRCQQLCSCSGAHHHLPPKLDSI